MYEFDMEKNIRELLKDTIFAHPDDVKQSESKKRSIIKPKKEKLK